MTVYNDEGKLMVKDGHGTSIIRYPTGLKAVEGTIADGTYIGRWRSWYPDGKRKEEGFYKEGVYSLVHSWDADGRSMVTDGNGYYKSAGDNGVIISEGPFEDGKANGLFITRTYENVVVSEVHYVAGVMDGEIKQYHSTAELAMIGEMKGDERVGVFTWYHMNGEKESEVTFVNGEKEGDQIFWSESGEVVKHEVYKSGELLVEGKGN